MLLFTASAESTETEQDGCSEEEHAPYSHVDPDEPVSGKVLLLWWSLRY